MKALDRLNYALESKVSGRMAWTFHRTKEKAFEDIKKGGLKPSTSGTYGPGLYTTYSLDSQLNEHMLHYGPIIIKTRIKLEGVLFCNEELGKQIYGSQWTLKAALVPKVVSRDQWIPLQLLLKEDGYTSDFAVQLMSNYGAKVRKFFKGIEYEGRTDGKCLLYFNPNPTYVTPTAFARSSNTQTVLTWEPLQIKQGSYLADPSFRAQNKIIIPVLDELGYKFKSKKENISNFTHTDGSLVSIDYLLAKLTFYKNFQVLNSYVAQTLKPLDSIALKSLKNDVLETYKLFKEKCKLPMAALTVKKILEEEEIRPALLYEGNNIVFNCIYKDETLLNFIVMERESGVISINLRLFFESKRTTIQYSDAHFDKSLAELKKQLAAFKIAMDAHVGKKESQRRSREQVLNKWLQEKGFKNVKGDEYTTKLLNVVVEPYADKSGMVTLNFYNKYGYLRSITVKDDYKEVNESYEFLKKVEAAKQELEAYAQNKLKKQATDVLVSHGDDFTFTYLGRPCSLFLDFKREPPEFFFFVDHVDDGHVTGRFSFSDLDQAKLIFDRSFDKFLKKVHTL